MMTSTQQIKTNAKNAFDRADYKLAFTLLLNLPNIEEFVSYVEKTYKKKDENTGKSIIKTNWFESEYFWTKFILEEEHFSELLSTESAIQLLHHYFKSYGKPIEDFEKKAAAEFPELFVKAIRVNQVFLESERIEFLLALELDEKFSIHQKFWEYCSKTDLELWKYIQIEFENVKDLPIENIFCLSIIWLETHRFQNSDNGLLHQLSKVYNFFIELLLSEYDLNNVQHLNSDDLFTRFLNLTKSIYNGNDILKNSSIRKPLELIFAWTNFYDNTVVPYCFDMNFEPVLKNGVWNIKESTEANEKWKKGELRYEANKLYYELLGDDIVECLEETGELVISGKTENDIEMNRDIEVRKWATVSILEDIQHEYFKIGSEKIHPQNLLMPLLGFTRNKFYRYEKNIDCYTQTSANWSEAFLKLTNLAISTDTQIDPFIFILMTEDDYKKLNEEVFSEIMENNTEEVLQLFSFRKNNSFDRFNIKYNVWHKPFIRFNNLLFTPTMFFANNSWFYTFTKLALKSPEGSSAKDMEKYLASKFEEKGLRIKVTTNTEANEMEGDVDIFVEDKDTLLFIQLKRTKFRLNPEEIYNEIVNIDSKASRQLNDAEQFLKNPNSVFDTKGNQPVKWIVTTSFENIGESINGCRKVNYFDVLYVLRTFEIKNLQDVITYIETDGH